MTPYQLWLVKTGRSETRVTHAMQRGTDLEPLARAAYEDQTGLVMQPLVLEIKCPLRGTRSDLWQDVQSGQVPTHYGIQVQHQLMVSGAALAHLWVFDGNQGILHAIEPDATVMEQIQAG